jgi:hypothetical protein
VTPAVPAQAQTACVWRPTDLPLPANAVSGSLSAASPDGRYFAGQAEEGTLLLWHDRRLTELAGTEGSWRAFGVNGSGHVISNDDTGAFVYRDGTKQYLPVPAGRIAFRSGVIRSADGTSVQIAGHPAVRIEKFQGGRVIGRVDRDFSSLREWSLTGVVARDYRISPSSPIGINRDGLLASGYFKSGTGNAYGAWQGSTFLGDVGPDLRVMAVTDTGLLAGYRQWRAEDDFWGPSTWTCSQES